MHPIDGRLPCVAHERLLLLSPLARTTPCCPTRAGPNVRVRLQKAKVGPYWDGLLAGKRKMPQLKVDWASWLDEDEETERSSAPTGFDVEKMKVMMVGSDKCELYRDLDRFESSTTPDEGEETNSIMIDEGMNSIDDLQIKFKALEYEKEETAKTKEARFQLRKKTREAQLFKKKRENDLIKKRPVRDFTEEELELLAGAETLYERLKAEKLKEKLYWLSKWWHVRRPEKRKIDMAQPLALQAALDAIDEELAQLAAAGGDIGDKKTRRDIERRVFIKSRQAALDLFNQWEHHTEKEDRKRQDQEGRDYTARDMGARITREEMAKRLGEPMPDLAMSMQLKQFADPRPKDEQPQKPGGEDSDDEEGEEEYSSLSDGWVTAEPGKSVTQPKGTAAAAAAAAAAAQAGSSDDDDGPALELEGNDGDMPALELEGNDGDMPALELEENDGDMPALELEENDGRVVELDDDDDDDGPTLELEENEKGVAPSGTVV